MPSSQGSDANFKKGRRADPGALGERESLACQIGPKFKLCTRSSRWSAPNRCMSDMDHSTVKIDVSRRSFFQLTTGWLAGIFATGASAVAAVRFLVPNVLFEPSLLFKAGKPEDYSDGVTFLEDERVFLVRRGNTFR